MSYAINVIEYLALFGSLKGEEFALQNQQMRDGKVIFTTNSEVARFERMVNWKNTGKDPARPAPQGMKRAADAPKQQQSSGDFSGPKIIENIDVLENVTDAGGWYTARCPLCAERGEDNSGNNLGVNMESGHWGCKKCPSDENGQIYAAFVRVVNFEKGESGIHPEPSARTPVNETSELSEPRKKTDTRRKVLTDNAGMYAYFEEDPVLFEQTDVFWYNMVRVEVAKGTGKTSSKDKMVLAEHVELLLAVILMCGKVGTLMHRNDVLPMLQTVTGKRMGAVGEERVNMVSHWNDCIEVLHCLGVVSHSKDGAFKLLRGEL